MKLFCSHIALFASFGSLILASPITEHQVLRDLSTDIPDSTLFALPCLFNLSKSTDLKTKNYLQNCKQGSSWKDGYYIGKGDGSIAFGSVSSAPTTFTDPNTGASWDATTNNKPNCDHVLEADEVKQFFDGLSSASIVSKYCWSGSPTPGSASYDNFRASALASYYVIKTLNALGNMLVASQTINIDKNKFLSGGTIRTAYQRANAVYQYLNTAKSNYDGTSAGIQTGISQFLSAISGTDKFSSNVTTIFNNAVANAKIVYDNKGN
ncbi:hypothetical protein GGI12_005860 [Dipsacomyces acuminosporus]|nr:hypothetical protein GGI12_005860 [Dipsacomyces acuminosporus]